MINAALEIPLPVLQSINADAAWFYKVIPHEQNENYLNLYISDDSQSDEIKEELQFLLKKELKFVLIESEILETLLRKYYPKKEIDSRVKSLKYTGESNDFITNLINEALSLKSSDIHIEAYKQECRVRIRIDGMLIVRYVIENETYPAIVNKIKILSNLDISEKRLPQDGRMVFANHGNTIDIRVSVLPTLYGEKVVLRLLSNNAALKNLKDLGFSEVEYDRYLEGTKKTNGLILISGPTGSGKTTTLYATLKLLNKETRNVLTIEDPIEYTLEGINQVQLKENIGLTFSSTLRNFLRQDPDIIMVGEIRDSETANMAVRASLTGHLVLSTIHTNSAWGTITRLMDMGVPSFLIANTLNLSVAQRLLRLLCPYCKKSIKNVEPIYPNSYSPPIKIERYYEPVGCDKCYGTGYLGRKAIYEVIKIDHELSNLIKEGKFDIDEYITVKEIKLLSDNAFETFYNGDTSLEEIYPILLKN